MSYFPARLNRQKGYIRSSTSASPYLLAKPGIKIQQSVYLILIGTYSSPKCSRIKLEITKGIEEGLHDIKYHQLETWLIHVQHIKVQFINSKPLLIEIGSITYASLLHWPKFISEYLKWEKRKTVLHQTGS